MTPRPTTAAWGGFRHRLAVAGMAGLVLLLVAPFSPSRAADPAEPQVREGYISSADGTQLRYEAYRDARFDWDVRQPVIVLVSSYLGTQKYFTPYTAVNPNAVYDEQTRSRLSGPDGQLAIRGQMLEKGYTFVNVTLRGYGGSGGCSDFYGPGELADTKAAVEWAASQPWSVGRVGIYGMSYPGGTALAAMAARPKGLEAVVAMAAPTGWRQFTWTNDVRHAGDFAAYYQQGGLHPPGTGADDSYRSTWLAGRTNDPTCHALKYVEANTPDPNTSFWAERDYRSDIARSHVPLLFSQGAYDVNVTASNMEPVLQTRGPRWIWFGQWQHDSPLYSPDLVGRTGFLDQAVRLFDTYVARTSKEDIGPSAVIQQGDGSWVTADAWPPKDTTTKALTLKAGAWLDVNNAFADYDAMETPSHLTTGVLDEASTAPGVGDQIAPERRRSWTFTEPLSSPLHVAGIPQLSLRLSLPVTAASAAPQRRGGINAVVALIDVAPDGGLRVITRGTARFVESGERTFPLLPQDYTVPAGHRLGIGVAGSDFSQRGFDRPLWSEYTGGTPFSADPGWQTPGSEIVLDAGTLSLPVSACAGYVTTFGGPGRIASVSTGQLDPTVMTARQAPGTADLGADTGHGKACPARAGH